MSVEKARRFLKQHHLGDRIRVFEEGTETVEKAAEQVGCLPSEIAKSMDFEIDERCILIVAAGDIRIDNKKYKEEFGKKAKMIKREDLIEKIGYPMGGVCPFNVNEDVEIYMDHSLKRFENVYPAGGSEDSVVELSLEELEKIIQPVKWVELEREV
ncbi:YbaK/EbsC family protein [Gallicola sp. Sow4_E12]|uniref:YbaK/EbsC family protein n=1 Tax=Gallicola sp. Sow4_E12 TaxID=3438785 RepID=UPI003F92E768